MGKFALFIVIASGFLISLNGMTARESSLEIAATEAIYEHQQLARSVAMSAFNIASGRLRDDFESYRTTMTGQTLGEGTYDLAVEGPECGPVVVTTTGYQDGAGWSITATFNPEGGVAEEEEPPDYMGAGITAGNNITIKAPLTLAALGSANSNLHADNDLKLTVPGAYVSGFGTAGNNLTLPSGQTAADIFHPNSNPDGDPLTQSGVAERDPQRPDRSILEPLADAIKPNDNWSGTYAMGGTSSDPTIWIYDGSTKTAGDVVFTGYGIIFIDGNLTLEHKLSSTGKLAIYVYNDMTINRDFYISGLLYVGNNLKTASTTYFTMEGPLTVRNDVTFTGPAKIGTANPASAYYTPLGHTPSSGGGGGSDCPGGTYTLTRSNEMEWESGS
jgi:hypothetical protein